MSSKMAPRPPPALNDDLIIDILLRLPPDDTACLTRASLVCKAWRRLLSDRAFPHRYREIHGAPPFLGFLYNNYSSSASGPLFVPTTHPSFFPPPASSAVSPTYCRTVDCRHGRVLLFHPAYYPSSITFPSNFNVWDPITGKKQYISAPIYPHEEFTAAVLCASNGCDHISCSGGPFLVVLLVKIRREGCRPWLEPVASARASLYSSDTGKWSASASIDFRESYTGTPTPCLLAGDTLFFMVRSGRILKYDLARGVLSAIWPCVPIPHMQNMILCTAEDGGLGVATVDGCNRLRLLSGRSDPDGVTEWAQDRVIELDSMISGGGAGGDGDQLTKFRVDVVGFAEGTSYIFIGANESIFSVEVKSGRISKIGSGMFGPVFPFVRFYIPDLASARLQGDNED